MAETSPLLTDLRIEAPSSPLCKNSPAKAWLPTPPPSSPSPEGSALEGLDSPAFPYPCVATETTRACRCLPSPALPRLSELPLAGQPGFSSSQLPPTGLLSRRAGGAARRAQPAARSSRASPRLPWSRPARALSRGLRNLPRRVQGTSRHVQSVSLALHAEEAREVPLGAESGGGGASRAGFLANHSFVRLVSGGEIACF